MLGALESWAPPCIPLGAHCSAPPLSSRPSLVLFLLCSVPHSGRHALAVGTTMVVADPAGCTFCSSDLGASPSPTGTCHSLIPHLWASALESRGPEGAGRCLWTPECARGAVRALRALLFQPGMPGGNLSPYPACSLRWALPWN